MASVAQRRLSRSWSPKQRLIKDLAELHSSFCFFLFFAPSLLPSLTFHCDHRFYHLGPRQGESTHYYSDSWILQMSLELTYWSGAVIIAHRDAIGHKNMALGQALDRPRLKWIQREQGQKKRNTRPVCISHSQGNIHDHQKHDKLAPGNMLFVLEMCNQDKKSSKQKILVIQLWAIGRTQPTWRIPGEYNTPVTVKSKRTSQTTYPDGKKRHMVRVG